MEAGERVYIGDGAYASFDGYGIDLSTERGPGDVHHVYLEPQVFEALLAFAGRYWNADAFTAIAKGGR